MATENDFTQGINLSGQTQVSGAQLEQLIREAKVEDHLALILVQDTEPDVTSNPRYARFPKIESAGSWFEYWNGTTWTFVPLPDDFVTNTMIDDNTIEIGKLSAAGGAPEQLIRVNAAGDGLEYFDFAPSIQTLDPNSIIKGTANQFLVTNNAGTATEWATVSTVFDNLGKVVNLSNLEQGGATTNQVLLWDGSAWVASSVTTAISDASITLAKLSASGTAGQVLKIKSGGVGVEVGYASAADSVSPGSSNQVLQTNSAGTAAAWRTLFSSSPAQSFATEVSWTHGLTYTPTIVYAVVKPTSTFANYASGTVIDSSSIGAGGTGGFEPARVLTWDGTTMKLLFKDNNGAANEPTIIDKSTKAVTEITSGDYASLSVYFIYSNF